MNHDDRNTLCLTRRFGDGIIVETEFGNLEITVVDIGRNRQVQIMLQGKKETFRIFRKEKYKPLVGET